MPKLRYMGRDADGEPIWEEGSHRMTEPGQAFFRKPREAMSFDEQVFDGYRKKELAGNFRSSYTKNDIKRTYGH